MVWKRLVRIMMPWVEHRTAICRRKPVEDKGLKLKAGILSNKTEGYVERTLSR